MIITDYAIRKKTTVFVIMFILAVTGTFGYLTIPREAAPDVEIPIIIVATPYRGVSPVDIEKTLTIPLERELKGLSGVKEMKSMSVEGSSIITIEFETNIEIDEALRKVKDRVDRAKGGLPKDADDPSVIEVNISEFPVMIINVYGRLFEGREKNLLALKKIADNLKDRILELEGILDVTVVGGLTPEVRIELDPDKLAAYRVPAALLVAKYKVEDVEISGGNTQFGKLKYDIRVPMEFERNVEAAKNIVIMNQGDRALYLADLAKIVPGFEEETSFSRFNKQESVSILVQKQSGKNLVLLAEKIKYGLDVLRKSGGMPDNMEIKISNDHSEFIDMVVTDLQNNILTGLILVIVVLFFFLGLKNSIFVALAIPFSLLITMTVLMLADITLNMIVLFSLLLSLGMLVDNAIVIVENIYRHRQLGYGRVEAAMKGTAEVAWPVITSTLTTVCAFSPMLFWPGVMGEFMGYLPMTVIICLASSLFVALVINPTLCAAFMSVKSDRVYSGGKRPIGRFMKFYRAFLMTAVAWRRSFVAGAFIVLFAMVFVYYFQFGERVEFFPSSDPNQIFVDVRLPEGSTLDATDRVVRKIEGIVTEIDKYNDIEYMVSSVGTRGSGDMSSAFGGQSATSYLARIAIEFVDIGERTRSSFDMIKEIREELSGFAGAELLVKKQEEGPPTGPPINVEFYGDDYDIIGKFAIRAKKLVQAIPGAVDVRDDLVQGRPELTVEVDRAKAALLGLSPLEVGTTIKTAYRGAKVGVFRIDDEEYDIKVIAPEKYRKGFHLLDKLYISTRTGVQVPASTVAAWKLVGGPGAIRRINQKRVVTVAGDIDPDPNFNANKIRKHIQELLDAEFGGSFPEGYGFRITGEAEEQADASAFLSKAFVIAMMLVALVLITQFNSLALPIIILFSVVLSFAGVFMGLVIFNYPFCIIMTGIGLISLVGVVVNNAIVLIDYIQKLRARGLKVADALVEAGMTRLRPVLLTAVTTILSLLPMVTMVTFDFHKLEISGGSEMSQMWGPMAAVVVCGLAFATLLTLIMVPTFYYMFYKGGLFFRRNALTDPAFGVFVARNGVLASDDVEKAAAAAAKESRTQKGVSGARLLGAGLHKALAKDEYIGEKLCFSQLADFTGYSFWEDLFGAKVDEVFRKQVSVQRCRETGMVAFRSKAKATCFGPLQKPRYTKERLYVAVSNPLDARFRENIRELKDLLLERFQVVLVHPVRMESFVEWTYSDEN